MNINALEIMENFNIRYEFKGEIELTTVTIGHFNEDTGEFYYGSDSVELNPLKSYALFQDTGTWDDPISALDNNFNALDLLMSMVEHYNIDTFKCDTFDGVSDLVEDHIMEDIKENLRENTSDGCVKGAGIMRVVLSAFTHAGTRH